MLFVKFVIIFAQEQRLLYYGSVMLLEGWILVFTILFDIVGQSKVIVWIWCRFRKLGR
jgi:hypothetical protein